MRNIEKQKASKKAYYLTHIEKAKTYQRAYQKIYYLTNSEKIKASRKIYYQVNRKKIKARTRIYYRANQEKVKLKIRKRRALRYSIYHEPYKENYVFLRDCWTCGICGRRINKKLKYPHPYSPSIDHIIPVSKGGNDSLLNVQAAHLRCNLGKHRKNFGQLRLFG